MVCSPAKKMMMLNARLFQTLKIINEVSAMAGPVEPLHGGDSKQRKMAWLISPYRLWNSQLNTMPSATAEVT